MNCKYFYKISAILYAGLQGYKSKYLNYHTKIVVALIYKINPVQITTITAENTENLLNSVPHKIENIQFKKNYCEKFSLTVKQTLALFLRCHGYCCTNIVNCSYAKHQKAAINCS